MCSPPNKDFWYTIKKVHSMESYYMESSLYYYSDLDKMTILAKDSFRIPSEHLKNEYSIPKMENRILLFSIYLLSTKSNYN